MNKATFRHGVIIAFLASMSASIAFFCLSWVFTDGLSFRLIISALTSAYLLYLLSRSQDRTGRITIVSMWLILLALLWLFYPPQMLFIVLHGLAIWLIRSLYCYASLLAALVDLALNVGSLACAFWALQHSGSLFLTVWCFFLVQALFVYIPTGLKRPSLDQANLISSKTTFHHAYQTAEAAVRKLSTLK